MQEARTTAASRKKAHPPTARPDGRLAGTGPAFNHYQAALQYLQQGKYEKALEAFNKLLLTAPSPLV
ncbi:MAG: tetratricopeptide repeat protein, partial [Terracidiphilus sp.]